MSEPRVITFGYNIKNKIHSVIEGFASPDSVSFLEGDGQIIPALEKCVVQLQKGQKESFMIPSAWAYGEVQPDLIIELDKKSLGDTAEHLSVGGFFTMGEDHHFLVTEITDSKIKLDGNHPLAGQDLVFNVEIKDIRPATHEEILHNHVMEKVNAP
jgi:FKBP-type peptidyl-prolyl cis-trans isomerase SlyD